MSRALHLDVFDQPGENHFAVYCSASRRRQAVEKNHLSRLALIPDPVGIIAAYRAVRLISRDVARPASEYF
jgi:hypothetical protein